MNQTLSTKELIHAWTIRVVFVSVTAFWLCSSFAQSPLPTGIQNQLGAGGGGTVIGGSIGGSGIGSMNGGLSALGITTIKGADPVVPSNTRIPIPVFTPLSPNAFQQYLLQVTGQNYPLFGANFFENIHQFENGPKSTEGSFGSSFDASTNTTQLYYPFAPFVNAPVSTEYVLGPGDQLLIRAWGSIDISYQAVIDRSGLVSLPKIGTFPMTGVKIANAESVIHQAISKLYKNFDLSVTLGQTRSITVYVVGQARRPGSYTLSSLSTLSSALFASGGPNNNGSMRRVQLKRGNQIISQFDLYQFLSKGISEGDVKLIDGDVLLIPPSLGYVALIGKLNSPAVFELKNESETLEQVLAIAGGLSITTNPLIASLERLDPIQSPPRSVVNLNMNEKGLKTILKKGDLVSFFSINPDIGNAVTLRGNVSQAMRMPWREGMRIHDLIPNREVLISRDSIRLQNEVLFDANQRERTQRDREQIPLDLLLDPTQQLSSFKSSSNKTAGVAQTPILSGQSNSLSGTLGSISSINPQNSTDPNEFNVVSIERWQQQRESRLLSQQSKIDDFKMKTLPDRIGQLVEQVNFDYAVVERIDRRTLNVNLLPFNLGMAIDSPNSVDNLTLESGDVVTIFSQSDIRVPVSKKRILVKIEGEVKNPGIYQASPGDTLSAILKRAGGLTPDAYLFGAFFNREEVRKTQLENLTKLLNRLESESSASLAQISQSAGASSDAAVLQAKIVAAQQTQKLAVERLKNLRPEGRVALGITPDIDNNLEDLPSLHLQNNDRLIIPSKPDFVYVYGSINTDSALLFKKGRTVAEYLSTAGVGTGADRDSVILLRADGTALTSNGSWVNKVMSAEVLPGDSIVVPEKLDRESVWSSVFRNTRDVTQIFYQLGLGAAAIKTLRN